MGKIRWYDEFKGYGYILQHDGQEVYFHCSSFREDGHFAVGIHVFYDLIETRMGLEATNLRCAA
ncbi:MAG: cold shock domain-containing protein [Bdellovibrionales bacterium]|nr:cold shock domain-containing protein [Bdellovibrionales bacterium]